MLGYICVAQSGDLEGTIGLIHVLVPQHSDNFLASWMTGSFFVSSIFHGVGELDSDGENRSRLNFTKGKLREILGYL